MRWFISIGRILGGGAREVSYIDRKIDRERDRERKERERERMVNAHDLLVSKCTKCSLYRLGRSEYFDYQAKVCKKDNFIIARIKVNKVNKKLTIK